MPPLTVLPGEAVTELPMPEPVPPLALEPIPLAMPPFPLQIAIGVASHMLLLVLSSTRAGEGCQKGRYASINHHSRPAESPK